MLRATGGCSAVPRARERQGPLSTSHANGGTSEDHRPSREHSPLSIYSPDRSRSRHARRRSRTVAPLHRTRSETEHVPRLADRVRPMTRHPRPRLGTLHERRMPTIRTRPNEQRDMTIKDRHVSRHALRLQPSRQLARHPTSTGNPHHLKATLFKLTPETLQPPNIRIGLYHPATVVFVCSLAWGVWGFFSSLTVR